MHCTVLKYLMDVNTQLIGIPVAADTISTASILILVLFDSNTNDEIKAHDGLCLPKSSRLLPGNISIFDCDCAAGLLWFCFHLYVFW